MVDDRRIELLTSALRMLADGRLISLAHPAPIRIVLHRDADPMGTKAGTSDQRLTSHLTDVIFPTSGELTGGSE